MFNRFAICFLLAGVLFGGVAVAQKPAPSPSPQPGDRAYTEEAVEKYKAAAAKYEALDADPKSDVGALNAAFRDLYNAHSDARSAIVDEADATEAVKKARENVDLAQSIVDTQIKNKTHPDEEVLQQKMGKLAKAKKEYARIWGEAYDRIKKAVAPDLPMDVDSSARHRALDAEARRKAEADALRRIFDEINEKRMKAEAEKKAKAEAEKKAQPSPSPEPKKTSCAPQGGLGGAMENVACQEQHSGSTH